MYEPGPEFANVIFPHESVLFLQVAATVILDQVMGKVTSRGYFYVYNRSTDYIKMVM